MPRKLLNEELRRASIDEFRRQAKRPVALVLDNLRSRHNIGAAFRTADAFAVREVALCGICAAPPDAEIHKAALGAENAVAWRRFPTTMQAVEQLRTEGYELVAVEQTEAAIPLNRFTLDSKKPCALIFGNEVRGVAQEVVDACDRCLEIPQHGTKHSLNVSVSMGVVLWEVCRELKTKN
ncbi:MAG: RNA methyltransferase [Prevotellaceae bacterium]|jgi:tRNA G18 (ribose-2'-O)-methylase SpoU|nr:RNA methyltransferase [Prevotellaceae bacterium]